MVLFRENKPFTSGTSDCFPISLAHSEVLTDVFINLSLPMVPRWLSGNICWLLIKGYQVGHLVETSVVLEPSLSYSSRLKNVIFIS